jgi:hypothetical protein
MADEELRGHHAYELVAILRIMQNLPGGSCLRPQLLPSSTDPRGDHPSDGRQCSPSAELFDPLEQTQP